MRLHLRTLLLGLTSLAIVAVEMGQLALEVRARIQAAEVTVAAQTRRLAAAGTPLLLNALVVGDLATAEQVLNHLNTDALWRRVILYETDGRHQILDASPAVVAGTDAPLWLARLLHFDLSESRLSIAAGSRVYAVLAVTPSSRKLEAQLWDGIYSTVINTALLIGVLLVLMNLILVYGLRPIQHLGRSAARLGAGDLAARVPETGLVEIASTARAFNTMATNLEHAKAALEERETERQRAERSRSARFAATRLLAEAETADEVLTGSLEAVARSIDWDAGEFWRVDGEAGVLRRAAAWHQPDGDTMAFAAARADLTVARNAGMLGEVWSSGKAVWADADDPAFTHGLASAVAVPVGGREVTGVMVFWSREAQPPDADLMTAVADIGRQIGQFLERREAEETLRAIEEQLRQAQKMEAIGKLAGGVAHDFNNLLTVIIGRCGLLVSRFETNAPLRHDLELIRTTADRAAALTRQLLAFGRKQVLQPRALDLNVVVEDIAPMLRRLIGEDVELTVRLRPELGHVMADPSQIEQVIVNLVVNARDAMPQGGQLTIETASVDLDAAYVRRHPGSRTGAHVMLTVSDTGIGMDVDTQARVFEPFFTTKEAGKGSGLGLATVYGIVKQSGGTVWVYSEPGRGTVFKVYLRRVDVAVEPRATGITIAEAPGGSETILLVEDQQEVRELAADILSAQGYVVLAAGDGETASALFTAHKEQIDLLLTDVVMPGTSGRQLADSLTAARPDLKVLYMSGYTDQAIVQHGVLEAGIAYLEKPFTIDAITRAVRDALDARPVGTAA